MDNVILIGMPTAGKSTVGVILAKLLAYDFIDTDLLIQRREGKSLSGIIDERGIDAFLAAEEGTAISMAHLLRAAVNEMKKNEIIVVREQLREYIDLLEDREESL